MARRSGQVVRRGERKWLVRAYRGEDEAGRRRYESRTVRGTKRQAEAELARMVEKIDRGALPERTTLRLHEWAEWWFENIGRHRLRERTLRDYRELLKRYVKPHRLWGMPLQKVQLADVQDLVTRLHEGRGLRRPLSARTVRYVHAVLSGLFKTAVRQGRVEVNPARLVELPRLKRKREMRALSEEEARRFLAATTEDRYHALFVLALDTGARPSELLALAWEHIDLEAGELRICRTLPRWTKAQGPRFEEPKTERGRRTVSLSPGAVRALRAHRAGQAGERIKLRLGPIPEGALVFTTLAGRPVAEPYLVAKHFKPALERAGLPRTIRFYDLRHTTASILLMRGLPPTRVAERLGHMPSMTLDVYGHAIADGRERVSEALGEALFGD